MATTMAKPTILHPQFFHTLVPGFHTHLTIPLEFFSKYIEGKSSVEKTTAELKSDSSDITWKVKMTGRRLSDGWEEFSVANNLQIGDVVVVRYEGDMVFHVSDLGPSCCEIQDIPPLSNDNYGQGDIGKNLLKKRLHPRTQVVFSSNDDDDEDSMELPIKKKVKKNSPEAEAEAVSSSSSDNSCFVAVVTPSSLRTDKMYLPPHFTSSNGLTRKCRKIVLIDGGERSWALDLRFKKTSESFYISRGWRNFCDENGREAGGFFMFKLLGNGETPVLNFCPTGSINDRRKKVCSEASGRESLSTEFSSEEENIEGESSEDDCSSMESLMETEKKKCSPKRRVLSYSSCHKRFVTFTLPPDYDRIRRLCLPRSFLRENGINKPGEIYLLGKDGKKWLTNLILDNKGTMKMQMSWKDFVKANGINTGETFTLKLIWEDTTPVLSLCPAECSIDRGAGEGCSETDEEKSIPIESLSTELNSGEENIYEESSEEESSEEESSEEECSEEECSEEESSEEECSSMESLMEIEETKYSPKRNFLSYSSYSPCHKRFVTFTLPPDYARIGKLCLPVPFVRENGINKPGEMYLLGKDRTKWLTNLQQDKKGTMSLGKGWKDFVKANGLNTGESFTLKLIWEDTIPMLSLCCAESTSDREQEEYFKTIRYSLFIDPCNRDKISREENNKEESRSWERNKNHLSGIYSTPSSQKQLVTLTITPSSVRQCRLRFPKNFTRDNDIHKPGTITLLGKDSIKQQTTLLFDKERECMALGNGWKDFAKENGLKTGDSFTLKLILEDTKPVLSLCPAECSIDKGAGGGCSVTDQKKSLPIEPSSCEKISKDENSREKNNKEENRKEVTMSMEREKNHLRGRDSTPSSQKKIVTLTITPSSFTKCRLILPAQFARENSKNKPGMIYLFGKDGTKWLADLRQDKKGTMSLVMGWKDFAEENDLKSGESFTMELIWEDGTHMLRLFHTKSSSSKANEKESISTEPRSRDSSSAIRNRFATLTLTPEDVRACKLHLPSQFMKANGIVKLGKITLLGKEGMKCSAFLLSKDGFVALGIGWKGFCEANGVKTGESFTLECIYEQERTTFSPVLKFCSRETNKYKKK